jgi:hypothetical protein
MSSSQGSENTFKGMDRAAGWLIHFLSTQSHYHQRFHVLSPASHSGLESIVGCAGCIHSCAMVCHGPGLVEQSPGWANREAVLSIHLQVQLPLTIEKTQGVIDLS